MFLSLMRFLSVQRNSCRVGWVSVATEPIGTRGVSPRVTHHTCAPRLVMVGYAWINALRSISAVAALTHPPSRASSVQREHEHVARVLELIEFDRMQMAAAGLHREILLGPDRIGHRRALERRADVEPPQLLELLVVIGDEPAVLQRGEDYAAGGDQRTGAVLDVGHRFGDHLVIDGVVGGHRAVVEVARVFALLALLAVDTA